MGHYLPFIDQIRANLRKKSIEVSLEPNMSGGVLTKI